MPLLSFPSPGELIRPQSLPASPWRNWHMVHVPNHGSEFIGLKPAKRQPAHDRFVSVPGWGKSHDPASLPDCRFAGHFHGKQD
jgi:hypothetical protein